MSSRPLTPVETTCLVWKAIYIKKTLHCLANVLHYADQVLMQQQKSRAFYRIQATRMMIGAGNILKKHAADQARKVRHARSCCCCCCPVRSLESNPDAACPVCVSQVVSSQETQAQENDPHTVRIDFEPALYQCFENCGSLKLTVARHGGESGATVKVCGIVEKKCAPSQGEEPKDTQTAGRWSSEVISLTSLALFLVWLQSHPLLTPEAFAVLIFSRAQMLREV